MLLNEWGFPILAASTERYFPGAQSSSLMANSGDGAFGAFRCRIYILIRLTQTVSCCLFGRFSAPLICECRVFKGTCPRRLRGCMLESILLLSICPQFCSSQTSSMSGIALSPRPGQLGLNTQRSSILVIQPLPVSRKTYSSSVASLYSRPCQVGIYYHLF
jgi:hypothetical protein